MTPPTSTEHDSLVGRSHLELSIVMPCLNEAETLERCIRKALGALTKHGISGEVVVADNGSTDGSVQIAELCGARVVHVTDRGYGSALMGGIEAARGRYLVIGDADDSYDFSEILPFVEALRNGADLVMGNRFKGGIKPGAMPWHHRMIGNPLLTGVLNLLFRSPIGDVHCGMRAFTKDAYGRMNLRTTGMEFASEMVVKACLQKMQACEVPISYSPDGRSRPPHLRSFRDGWRHLRFLLMYSPRWLFAVPGIAALALGLAIIARLWAGPVQIGRITLDVHMMLLGSLLALLGFQILCVGAFAKAFAVSEYLEPQDTLSEKVLKHFTLERGLAAGGVASVTGLLVLAWVVMEWYRFDFGPLEPVKTLRPAIAGMTLVVLGVQTIFASFFLSILGLKRR